MNPPTPEPGEKKLLEFPTRFIIKVMGKNTQDFQAHILKVVQAYAPDLLEADISATPSSKGTYLGLSVTVNAVSQEQLDNIYRALTADAQVKVAL